MTKSHPLCVIVLILLAVVLVDLWLIEEPDEMTPSSVKISHVRWQMPEAGTAEAAYSGKIAEGNVADGNQIIIDVRDQMGFLVVDGTVTASTPIAISHSASIGNTGTFAISRRSRGGIPGEHPYRVELAQSKWAMHAGPTDRHPSDQNSICLPEDMAELFYDQTEGDITVEILNNWQGAARQ